MPIKADSLSSEVGSKSNIVSLASINIEGFWRMSNECDLLNFIHDFDIILLLETFLDSFSDSIISTHKAIVCPGVKVSDSAHGRLSGGLIFLIRNELSQFVQQIHIETDNILVLKVASNLFGTQEDCLLIGAYLPPENAKYYENTDIYNGVALLEDCLLELSGQYNNCPLIICGDLNARTGVLNTTLCDPLDDICQMFDNDFSSTESNDGKDAFARDSKDSTVNAFGRFLLSVCEEFNLVIVNGLKCFNWPDAFTYVSEHGCSVIDYIIVSHSLLSFCKLFSVLPMIESKHAVVKLCVDSSVVSYSHKHEVTSTLKYKWDDEKKNVFLEALTTDYFDTVLNEASSLVEINVNCALEKFNEGLRFAGNCMQKTIYFGIEKSKVWFDVECRHSRQVLRKFLHKFTKFNTDEVRLAYIQKRREYKELLKNKKQSHKENVKQLLQHNIGNPRQFWEAVRSVRPKAGVVKNSISAVQWFDHFYGVFNENNVDAEADIAFDTFYYNAHSDISSESLNSPISVSEVVNAITSLKNQKAAGPDRLIGEFYKNSADVILPFLVKLFNYIFDNGIFPEEWTVAVIQPLHKKGDLNLPDNYRGISLLNICSKIYSFVLNQRIANWAEVNNVIGEEQAGFREKRCTTDNIFCLLACVQKQLVRHRKLYVAFIDFKKAFDTVSRNKLWTVLHANGIDGKMLCALKSMYSVVKARVRAGAELSDVFYCPRGLKQGEVCSPILFSLLINELTKEINDNGRHGVQLAPDIIQLLILLFADDVALLSDSIIGLQTQLNILYDVAKRLDLVVNLDKSDVVIFRNGGFVALNERWFYGPSQLTVVSMYKYLGIYLTTRLSFQSTFKDLSERASKGVSALIRMLWSVGEHSPAFFFKLFDTQIQPILTYGSEIWGLTPNQNILERVHLSAMKRFLCVSQKAPRHVVYGELGRYPLYVNTYIKCIKFWLRIVSMHETRLPRKSYNMLLFLQKQNYVTWACSVRNILFMYGFGIVWEAQSVGDVKRFIVEFKQRLKDCYLQDWNSSLQSHTFYETYSTYTHSLSLRPYIVQLSCINVRKIFSRFRMGMLPLNAHSLRFDNCANSTLNTNCPFCKSVKETEFHFLLVCPLYNVLRKRFLPEKFFKNPTLFKMSLVLSSENTSTVVRVCHFVYKAYIARKNYLQQFGTQ